MADYDIGAAFAAIEDELISSMIRNLERHKVEEIAEGMQWSQWQVEQLKALEDYKRKAAQKFGAKFSSINDKIEEMLTSSFNDGATTQERDILKAIKKGLTSDSIPFTGNATVTGEFFKTNDRKLDALIKATTSDMQRAETAVLRMADDKYRKIIFNAQVYANTGAGTYEKAVDMATKDFLSAGINCIEYRNGRRVNIKSYADMAIRTASKRAYLQGEGGMRKKWGIHTVILNKRSNACPLCTPFVGKIFIDDVWSGGTAEEALDKGYPLLSDAIAQGLYHPNCRDAHTTYFGDILDDEDEEEKQDTEPLTEEERKQCEELYTAEQKEQYAERQAERMERMSKYSLDEDNKRAYGARAEQWREKVHRISDPDVDNNLSKSLIKSDESIAKATESDTIGYEYSPKIKESVRAAFDAEFKAMSSKFGVISTISRIEPLMDSSGDYGAFYDHSGLLAIRAADKKDCLKINAQKAVEMKKAGKWSSSHPMHTFRHEIGHAIQAEHAKNDPMWKNKIERISKIMKSLPEFTDLNFKGIYSVSKYAMEDIDEFISECIAESMTKKSRKIAKDVVNIILGVD